MSKMLNTGNFMFQFTIQYLLLHQYLLSFPPTHLKIRCKYFSPLRHPKSVERSISSKLLSTDQLCHSLPNGIALMLPSVLNCLYNSFQSFAQSWYLTWSHVTGFPMKAYFLPLVILLRHNQRLSYPPNATTQQILLKTFSGDGGHEHYTLSSTSNTQ